MNRNKAHFQAGFLLATKYFNPSLSNKFFANFLLCIHTKQFEMR